MIILEYTKDDKNLVKRLASALEKKGLECWYYSRDAQGEEKDKAFANALDKADAIVFVFSFGKDKDEYLIKRYKKVFDTDKPIVFFITDKPYTSLSKWHFLNTVDWVNAYDVSFETSSEALFSLLSGVETGTESVDKEDKKQTDKKTKNTLTAVIAVVLVALAAYFMFRPDNSVSNDNTGASPAVTEQPATSALSNTTAGEDKITEANLIGTWRLVDYKDDIPRSPEEQAQFVKTIEQLKKTFSFTFYKDHTFVRYGFNPAGDKGYWTLDPQNKALYISDTQGTGKDKLKIIKLTKDEFIFEVVSHLDNQNITIVRFHLKKAQ